VGLKGKPVEVQIEHANGETETIEAPEGFHYGDFIVGSTDPDLQEKGAYDPYRMSELPRDRRARQDDQHDYFKYRERMQRLAGRPVVLQARAVDADANAMPVSVLVPPVYHKVIPGLRMKMGKVRAVRNDSPAKEAGVLPNDRILRVELTDGKDTLRLVGDLTQGAAEVGVTVKQLDPLRSPYDLRQWAKDRHNVKAVLVVGRGNEKTKEEEEPKTLPAVAWDNRWQYDHETPIGLASPMSIPELGVAYFVQTLVDAVKPGSPAAANLDEGDEILAFNLKQPHEKDGPPKWFKDDDPLYKEKGQPEPWWAAVFGTLQSSRVVAVRLNVKHGGEEKSVEMELASDRDWPRALSERPGPDGDLYLMPDSTLEIYEDPLQAMQFGVKRTYQLIVKTYMSLVSMLTGRVSAAKNLQGPLRIAEIAYSIAGEGFPEFLRFLAIISLNLAVINFLPIPVLDGGHMVFLIYEKLRGKPASEQVRLGFTYLGLLLILSLMAFVLFLDVRSYWRRG
jgi:regulator of sigma E protease